MLRAGLRNAAWMAVVAGALVMAGCVGSRSTGPQAYANTPEPAPTPSSARARAQAHLDLAHGYFDAKRYEIALAEAKEAQAADPEFVAPYTLAGLASAALGDKAGAEAAYARALALAPRDARVLHNLAWQECEDGDYAKADQHFDQALAASGPGRSTTLLARGICQARAGNDVTAIATLIEAHELDVNNPVTLYNLALLQYRHGELDAARGNARRLNNSTLANAQSLWLGVRIEHRLGDLRSRGELATQLLRRYPDSPELQALEKGNYDE